jgi:hypothetical protein
MSTNSSTTGTRCLLWHHADVLEVDQKIPTEPSILLEYDNKAHGWSSEGPIRREDRGEQMEVDKNSSPKRELGLCPKSTTKDSHTSLPRSRSHNGPTNTRNKSQTNLTQKHN